MRKFLIGLVLALLPLPVWGQWWGGDFSPRYERCITNESDEARILSCSVVIGENYTGNPGFLASMYTLRSQSYTRLGDFDDAMADITRALSALQNTPNTNDAKINRIFTIMARGELYMKMGKVDLGKGDLTQAIAALSADIPRVTDLIPHQPYYSQLLAGEYNGRAWAHHLLGEESLALPDVTKALEIDPKADGTLETRAEIYEKMGRPEDAIADYRASLALFKNKKTAIEGLERLGAIACSRPGLVVTALAASHGLPAYPKESLGAHEEGATILRVTIGTDGTPADVAVDRSSGSQRLDNAFAEKVKSTYRWQPPTRDCKPITAEAHLRLAVHLLQVNAVPPEAEFHVTMPASSYPPGAAEKLEWGETLLEITTDAKGAIQDGRVIRTSKFADLDDQALAIVKRSPELMKGTSAGKHILAAAWHLPAGIFPADYEMLEMTAMQITASANP